MAGRVILAGVVHNASWYTNAFDVYVAPSLHEGFGLGLLEGMAASLPILTSTGGATPEVAGDAGLSFAPGDSDTLAEHMKTVYLMNDSERTQMGQSSLQRLQENFSRETYHNNVVQLFAS